MLNTVSLKFLTQPVIAGVVLSTAVIMAFPPASQAQRLQKPAPATPVTPVTPLPVTPGQNRITPVTPVRQTPPNTENIPTIPATLSVTLDRNYTLGGGDRIKINVFEVPEYTSEYAIPPGGSVNLPLVGSVSIEGLTTEQAADLISQKYSRYLKRPLISVNLLSPRPINVVVAGEVSRPGAYTLSLSGGAGNDPGVQYPTVLSALTTAQGVLASADFTKVELRRRTGRGPERVAVLNLDEIRRTGRIPQDITLRDGDTIFVPQATSLDLATARNLAASSFAADPTKPRTVAVVGEVLRPGSYLVAAGSAQAGTANNTTGTPEATGQPTVVRALQLAGGITPQANVREVKLRRLTRTGGEQLISVNLWKLIQSGDINQDLIVQDGDTIIIPTATSVSPAEATQLATTTLSPASIEVNIAGEIKKPGTIKLQPNSSLNQALLASGGFNDGRANRKAVDLIRLNPDGSVTKRLVKIDLKAGLNEQTNPILRNNDIILVSRNGLAKTGDSVSTFLGPLGSVFGIFNFLSGL
ncbi:SLBB domain-containing protein [Aetokthonos hydrillicola Thurmond2011]|jgi:polysaccharide export outer membrane protein|uniref:SLBB domain-containing protein n=1 Tax=Aetokthonos hydrillicola Thurmond2011 TaxID=2712845 RepID=A0AAP5MCV5_9CYAN|nr:polysaccharide biosynthesis/export family protein [Aetokthonos hydrillicola]MBW4584257.1 SLBB domain-containing protein [Aetokthonos hydrillicola CCALA 1050]MDR9898534.1 SLBB domain-containing protein [Aetokthonos hydrillicola Thurmond2011]